MTLSHKFVKNIPENPEDGVIYISIEYATVIHKCCCGCGRQVVTPLSPTDWKLIFNGKTLSLYPSIGNWSFPCQSHYWITESTVVWAPKWTKKQIDLGKKYDELNKEQYFKKAKNKSLFRFLFKRNLPVFNLFLIYELTSTAKQLLV